MTYCIHHFYIECLPGQFGMGCRERCSGYCLNNEPCEHVSGVCSNGCQNGFIGTNCNNCKEYSSVIL